MKYLEKNIEFKISQLDFILTPLQITFETTQAHAYVIQLGKGPQVYKKFNQHLWVHANEKSYKFVDQQSATFKLQNQKSLVCEWSLYKMTDSDLKDFMYSVTADLSKYYGIYIQKLKKYSKEYLALLNSQLNGQQIAKEWSCLKDQIKDEFELQCANQQQKIELLCKLKIRCEMDVFAEQEIMRAKEKKNIKIHSKQSASFSSRKSVEDEQHNQHFRSNIEVVLPESESFYSAAQIKIIQHQPAVIIQTLSDIQEVSVRDEYSSNRNYDQKHSKKHSALSEAVNELLKENYEPSSPLHPTIRTQNFDKLKIMEDIDNFKRYRSNTSDQNLRKQTQNKLHFYDTYNVSEQNYKNQVQEHQQEKSDFQQGIETAPQSQLKTQEILANELPLRSEIEEPAADQIKPSQHSFKAILILLLLLVITFASLQELTGEKWTQNFILKLGKQKNSKKEERKSKVYENPKEQKRENKVRQENSKVQKRRVSDRVREQQKIKETIKQNVQKRGQSKQKTQK